jgi:hypothetical protein
MDIDYTCGHKFQMRPGAFPQDCPECGKGMAIGVNARFYMSDDLSKKMREAAMSVKPLTGKEQPENNRIFAYYTCGCVLGTETGGIVPNRCEKCSKGGQFFRSLDHQVEPYAWICPKCHDHNQQICDKCLSCGTAKPVAQEWGGEGWPTINSECWFCDYSEEPEKRWKRCIFLGVHEENAIWIYLVDQNEYYTETNVAPDHFRPINHFDRQEVIRLAKEATDRMAGQKVEVPLGHLYDIGMLRKAGDQ